MGELDYLARTAGARVVGRVSQRSQRFTSTYLGTGKLQELRDKAAHYEADVVIFDDELSPSQQAEARRLPRHQGNRPPQSSSSMYLDATPGAMKESSRWNWPSTATSYPAWRGSGPTWRGWAAASALGDLAETQLETDRRLVRRRIQRIEHDLTGVRRRRTLYMGRRKKSSIPIASLVGYTNAGKSTLFNSLSGAAVDAEDQLFSTLDPVTRRIRLPSGGQLLLTDTVGFIQKLSPMVVAAFRATLEELAESDILLHVVDITHSKAQQQTKVVDRVLNDLDLGHRPRLLVANKIDLLPPGEGNNSSAYHGRWNPQSSVRVSAAKGWNLDLLLQRSSPS